MELTKEEEGRVWSSETDIDATDSSLYKLLQKMKYYHDNNGSQKTSAYEKINAKVPEEINEFSIGFISHALYCTDSEAAEYFFTESEICELDAGFYDDEGFLEGKKAYFLEIQGTENFRAWMVFADGKLENAYFSMPDDGDELNKIE